MNITKSSYGKEMNTKTRTLYLRNKLYVNHQINYFLYYNFVKNRVMRMARKKYLREGNKSKSSSSFSPPTFSLLAAILSRGQEQLQKQTNNKYYTVTGLYHVHQLQTNQCSQQTLHLFFLFTKKLINNRREYIYRDRRRSRVAEESTERN